MATNIILKKSSILGRVPNDSALAYGELAINYTDGKLYYKHSSQTVRSFLDENQIISLIDSDYVAARAPAGGGGGGTDSAQVIGIIEDTIDSDYIVARLGTVGSPLVVFNYEADSGQSEFTGADVNGNALSYQAEDLLVFVNGILLIDSDDYTATNGSSISLFVPADSGDLVTIAAFNIRLSAGLDSAGVTTLIDSDYINSRVTATAGTDSAQVISLITDTVDSAYIQSRQAPGTDSAAVLALIEANGYTKYDSANTISLIDSDYIQSRQTLGYSAGTINTILIDGNLTSDKTYDGIFWTDGSETTGIGFKQGDLISWNPANGSVTVSAGGLYEVKWTAYMTSSGSTETGDQRWELHKNGSGYIASFTNVAMLTSTTDQRTTSAIIRLEAGDFIQLKGGTGSSWRPRIYGGSGHTFLQVTKMENGVLDTGIDSSTIVDLIDSDYIAARTSAGTDSSTVISLITDTVDSAYVASRTPEVDLTGYATESYVTTQISNLVDGAPDALNTLNELAAALNDDSDAYNSLLSLIGGKLDSNGVIGLIDSNYIQSRQITYNVLDSAQVAAIAQANDTTRDSAFVTGIIDSDYINARVTATAGTDSAQVISLITDTVDSAYIAARVYVDSDLILSTLGTGQSPLVTYQFTADSGQTVFSGSDDNGRTLSYTLTEDLLVFVNGVLLAETDYTATSGTSLTLAISADSADIITISRFNILDAIQNVSPIEMFVYTADSGQTIFSGADDNSNTLSYQNEKLLVYLNGVLLVDSADYTATSGTSVILTSATAVDDVVSIATFNMARGAGIDSSAVLGLIDSDYIAARSSAGTDSSTVISLITDTVDSAYIQARQLDIYRDSAFVTGIIDSDYIAARSTPGTDSATVAAIVEAYGYLTTALDSTQAVTLITSTVDSAYVNARVTATAGTDSAQVISLITDTVDSSYILSTMGVIGSPLALFTYEADSGQTTFSGTDLSGQSLYYNNEDILVYLNGLLLKDSTDYTANNGTSVVLNLAADSGDVLTVASFNIRLSDGLDSADVVAFIDSDYIAARSAPGTDSSTVISIITDTVDTPFVVDLIGQAVDSTSDVYFNSITIGANAVIQGDLQVSGTTTTVDAANLSITDNMIYLNAGESDGSPTAFIDIGFAGNYNDVGSYAHTGFFRDATDGVWKIFEGYTPEPDSSVQIDTTHASFSLASLAVKDITGQYLGFDSDFGTKVVSDLVNDANYLDSAGVINLVDSDYINARVTAQAGTDSAQVISLITDTVDSSYIGLRIPNTPATISQFKFVATNGQTAFTGADFNGNTLAYNASSVQVYMNGVRLVDSDDYTALNGTSISLASGATTGDQLVITNASGIGGSVDLSAVSQNIIPFADSAYDLGSPTKKFRSLYLSGNTLYLGSLQLKDSAGELSIVDSDGASVSVGGGYVSTYALDGTLQPFNGSQRKYIHDAFTLATVDAYLVTGPSGSSVTVRINKNGTSIGTITIADGTTKTENTVFGTSFIKGDYITVDITAVGSTTPGTDLYLNFIFS